MEEKEKMKLDSKVDIEALIEDIKTYIYENHKQDITGEILQETLVDMAKETGVVYEEMLVRVANSDKSILELAELIDSNTEGLINDLKDTNTKLDTNIEKTKLDDLALSQKIDNLASNIIGLGNNIKGEAKGGDVINLPPISLNSVAPSYRIEGLTATQLVQNGDFRDGIKGWGHLVEGRDILTITNDGFLNISFNEDYPGSAINLGANFKFHDAPKKGEKMYLLLSIRDYLGSADRYLELRIQFQTHFKKNMRDGSMSSIFDIEVDEVSSMFLTLSGGVPSFKDSYTIESMKLINLTKTFGAGNEPTKEWCDEHFPEYFDGTKSVELPVRIKSVGENLWDNSKAIFDGGVVRTETGYFKRKGAYGGSKMTLKVKMGVEYELSLKYTGQARSIIREFESRKTISPLSSSTKRIFKSKSGLIEVVIDSSSTELNTDVEVSNIQVAKTPSSGFGKYAENLSYINSKATLKSALQAKDYVENGTLFKNIFTTKEFKKDDVRRQYIHESLVNTYAFYFDIDENKWLKDGFVNNNRVAIFSDGETYPCVGSAIETDVADIVFFIEGGRNYIVLKVNKTKIDKLIGATPLDKFKTYMGNRFLTIDYQANTEQVKLDTSGVVTTHENGTIFIDYIKNRTDIYNKGVEVLDFKELVSLQKYESVDLIELDTSKAKYASNKLTHTDLKDGDIVFFEYRYTDLGIYGENTIEYFNQNNVLQSENGKVWRKVEVATNDGQLTTKLEEVK